MMVSKATPLSRRSRMASVCRRSWTRSRPLAAQIPHAAKRGGGTDDLAKRLGGWTEDATAARYDHAERVEELRTAVEKAK